MGRGSGPEEDDPSAPAWRWFLLGFAAPALVLFWDVIAGDRNFAYRDAGHFYYPYYKLIADEWKSGRVPLWNPYENGGEPLAAQPTAAVWYPGKLLFLLPYPLAFKLYHLGHLALAWWTAFWCARTFGMSRAASAFAGTAYSLSGFVLFQLYNVVFLVGAAWLPLGLACLDRVVREASLHSAFGLAAILALQILGGDPEIAVLTLLVGLPYLLIHRHGRRGFWWGVGLIGLGHGLVFFGRSLPPFEFSADAFVSASVSTLALHWLDAALKFPAAFLGQMFNAVAAQTEIPFAVAGETTSVRLYLGWTGVAALVVGVVLLFRRGGFSTLWRDRALRLWLLAALFAGCLSAVQVLPTRDLVAVSDRSAPLAPHESAAFSLFPARLVETAFPVVFGRQFPVHARWAPFMPWENGLWTASLYLGLPALVFGLAMFRWRRDDPRVVWTSWVLVLTLWLALGKFGGLYWLVDPGPGFKNRPIDAPRDTKIYGVSDGLYRFCEEVVPLFASFRYPEKSFVFCTFALAMLGGWGVDRRLDAAPRFRRVLTALVGAAAILAVAAWMGRGTFERYVNGLGGREGGFGPLDGATAWRNVALSFLHAAVVGAALLALAWRGRSAVLLVALLAVDLVVANRWLVLSEPQVAIDAKPELAEIIERAEASNAELHPFRIHRTRIYTPPRFGRAADAACVETMNAWERNTLQPKYGLPLRLSYATTAGTMSIYDVEFFFAPWTFPTPEPIRRQFADPPQRMTYYPRVGYNLWGVKYFILPAGQPLDHDERGVFTLVFDAAGHRAAELARSGIEEDDFVLLKNTEALPRAWIVHQVDVQPPIFGLRREDRKRTMERLLYRPFDAGLNIWEKGQEFSHRSTAIVEIADPGPLQPFNAGGSTDDRESVRFMRDEPGRIELEATLLRPGFVVLSNAYYRGWTATIDGKSAPILRGNRAMQTIPVAAGTHRIVLAYSCRSTLVGGAISLTSWIGLGVWRLRNRKLRAVVREVAS